MSETLSRMLLTPERKEFAEDSSGLSSCTTLKIDSTARTSWKRKQESEEEESIRPLKKHREVTPLHSTSKDMILKEISDFIGADDLLVK
jgi:hypothetical protein